MGGVVRLKNQRLFTNLAQPVGGELRRLEKAARPLDAGAFVIRKAAVQKYGALIRRFATGGMVDCCSAGAAGADEVARYEAAVDVAKAEFEKLKSDLEAYSLERNKINSESAYFAFWRRYEAMQAEIPVKDAEIKGLLLDLARAKQKKITGFASGGSALAKTDTVPAMLTPGEYVINRSTVARFGAGFFDAINNLAMPAQAIAQRVQGFASGGLVQAMGPSLIRPNLPAEMAPGRTVRVELAAGERKIAASIDARDESRLLHLLDAARTRMA